MSNSFRVFHAMHQANAALFSAADKSLKSREGIITAHQIILFVLCKEDGLPSTTIAKRAGMSKTRLTGLVDNLVAKKLVRRQLGEKDGRQKLIFVEPEGRAMIDRTKGWVNELNAALMDNYDDKERAVIQRFLNDIIMQSRELK